MKCVAKIATRVGQFCTSVLVAYADFYVNFSLPRAFLDFSMNQFLKRTGTMREN